MKNIQKQKRNVVVLIFNNLDMFHGLGDRLLAAGYSTPFLHVGFTRMYASTGRVFFRVL